MAASSSQVNNCNVVNIERTAYYTSDLLGRNHGKTGDYSSRSSNGSVAHVPANYKPQKYSCYYVLTPFHWFCRKMRNLQLFPTFRNYSFKSNLLLDLNAALILTALVIPQCMAYAILAKMPPVVGIYISIIQPLIYAILGTCPSASFGTFALLSMLVGDSIDEICKDPEQCSEKDRISIGASQSFIMGLLQMFMMLLNFGKIAQFLDQTIVRAFTTAIAFHISASQIKNICFGAAGIEHSNKIPPSDFPVIGKLYEAGENIDKFNVAEFVIFLCSLLLLLPSKAIVQMLKKRWKYVEFPMDFIVVFIAAFLNYTFDLGKKFGISSVGEIHIEMHSIPPKMRLNFNVFKSALVLSVVAVSMHLSFIKVFNSKSQKTPRNKQPGTDQEILAAGFTNFVSSFFSCYPGTVSLSRSVVLFENDAKSQLTGVVSSCFMVIAYLLLRSALEYIPMAVLAAIIVTALRNLFKQFKDIPQLYKSSKLELGVWIVTFIMSFTFSCEIGLLVGFGASIFRHLYLQNQATVSLLHNAHSADDLLVEKEQLPADINFSQEPNTSTALNCNGILHSTANMASFCALRVTGPVNSITVEYVTTAITSYTKKNYPSLLFSSSENSSRSKTKGPKVDSKTGKKFGLCSKLGTKSPKAYDKLSDEGSMELIPNGNGHSSHEQDGEIKSADQNGNDVTVSLDIVTSCRREEMIEDEDDELFFILDINHVAYFDFIGIKVFQETLTLFRPDSLILICCRHDISQQLQDSNKDIDSMRLKIVPTFVDALACMPTSQSSDDEETAQPATDKETPETSHEMDKTISGAKETAPEEPDMTPEFQKRTPNDQATTGIMEKTICSHDTTPVAKEETPEAQGKKKSFWKILFARSNTKGEDHEQLF